MNAPGWYGKLPTLGDFASRRLDDTFMEAWDAWLALGLTQLQGDGASDWPKGYLESPSWRFILMPGALKGAAGKTAWAGVLMPSVDRVGRYFPFTIAQPLADLPLDPPAFRRLSDWCDKVDEIAVNALFNDWSLQQLEDEILATPLILRDADVAPLAATSASNGPEGTRTFQPLNFNDLMLEHALCSLTRLNDMSLWLANAHEGTSAVIATRGLPSASEFGALLGGKPLPHRTLEDALQITR
jgi:type VI secretion system protein ImpM